MGRDRVTRRARRPAARVLGAITTASGSARACSRAAKFGVSPTTPCSCAAPDPTRSPTTTSPVAMPTRTCSCVRPRLEPADGLDQLQTGADRPLGIVLVRLRIAEIDQHAVAHVLGDEAVEPGDTSWRCNDDTRRSPRAGPRGRVAGERRRADEVAEHHRELPALGLRPRFTE